MTIVDFSKHTQRGQEHIRYIFSLFLAKVMFIFVANDQIFFCSS
jgi:hypothetical protein